MSVRSCGLAVIDIYIRVYGAESQPSQLQGAYAENSGLWASIACSRRFGQ